MTEDYFYKAMLIPEFCQVYLKCLEVSIKKTKAIFLLNGKIENACIQYKRKKFKKRKLFHIFT